MASNEEAQNNIEIRNRRLTGVIYMAAGYIYAPYFSLVSEPSTSIDFSQLSNFPKIRYKDEHEIVNWMRDGF